jgi:hypothetical protein
MSKKLMVFGLLLGALVSARPASATLSRTTIAARKARRAWIAANPDFERTGRGANGGPAMKGNDMSDARGHNVGSAVAPRGAGSSQRSWAVPAGQMVLPYSRTQQ